MEHAPWRHTGVLKQFDLSKVDDGELVGMLEVLETSADRVACGLVEPPRVLGFVAELFDVKGRVPFYASMVESRTGVPWSTPVTAEERITSLMAAAAVVRAEIDKRAEASPVGG